jgi:hypothetical protein
MIASTYKAPMPMPGMMPPPMMGEDESFAVFDDNGQNILATDALPTGVQATQPSLSADDGTLVYVVPSSNTMYGISTAGDHHFYGGSLYTSTFDATTNALGTPSLLIASTGTPPSALNFYYPDIAADNSFVVFNEAPSGDAFYNVNARVKLLHLPAKANAQPIDMPALNVADGLTNSWPRWSPVVQTYKGHRLLWVTFSSNRDYGLHLSNDGFPNCYPPESPSYDQPQPLSKMGVGYEDCAQPQIWMAAVIIDPDASLDAKDRSFPAFWLPFQDVTAHNHSPQWVEQIQGASTPDGGAGGSGTGDGGTEGGSSSCGQSGAACGVGSPLCCTDVVCCVDTCEAACVQ